MKTCAKNVIQCVAIMLLLVACAENQKQEMVVRPVKVERPTKSASITDKLVLPASINERYETKLSFRVGGPLIQLNDVIGSYVNTNEVIAKIDPRDYKIAIEATETRYNLAKAEYERYKNLAVQGSVSKSVFDQMESNYKLAKTDYESAKNAMKDSELRAPFSGYINAVYANNFEKVTPGLPVISLLDISQFEVNAWISAKDAALINEQTKFTCIVKQGDVTHRILGQLKEIGNKTGLSKQSLPITVTIQSSDNVKLNAGIASYLEIENSNSKKSTTSLVSLSSIFTKDNETNVWVYNTKTSKVSAKKVSTGKVSENGTIEITKGLAGDETIVCAGVHYLFEGQTVKKMAASSKSNVGNKL